MVGLLYLLFGVNWFGVFVDLLLLLLTDLESDIDLLWDFDFDLETDFDFYLLYSLVLWILGLETLFISCKIFLSGFITIFHLSCYFYYFLVFFDF